jgi:hypothetical protein
MFPSVCVSIHHMLKTMLWSHPCTNQGLQIDSPDTQETVGSPNTKTRHAEMASQQY